MRVATVTVLVVAVLALAPGAAVAQDSAGRAASELPTQLFEPPPDGVPAGARGVADGSTRGTTAARRTLCDFDMTRTPSAAG